MFFITQVPLGIMMKNENKLDEMVAIMLELGKYVPCQEAQKDIVVDDVRSSFSLHRLPYTSRLI